jgi:hypothetical protein
LIGVGHSKLGLPFCVRQSTWNQPVATKTRLGWIVHGKDSKQRAQHDSMLVIQDVSDTQLHELVNDYLTLQKMLAFERTQRK